MPESNQGFLAKIKEKTAMLKLFFLTGAGDGSRTRVTSLENWNNSRYMTPAVNEIGFVFYYQRAVSYTLVYDTYIGHILQEFTKKSTACIVNLWIYSTVN